MSRYHPGLTKTEAMAMLTTWIDRLAHHDCAAAEDQLDILIASGADMARQLGRQDAELANLTKAYAHALVTIETLRAQVLALRALGPTPTEMRVRQLGRRYHGERSER